MFRAAMGNIFGAYLRNTPKHRGRFQLAKVAFQIIGKRPVRGAYGVTMLSNAGDATNILAQIGGAFDDVFSEIDTIAPGMAFIDVGANAGVFSLVAGNRVGKEGIIVAFEPSRSVYSFLVANAELNDLHNFYPFMAAIGSTTSLQSFDEVEGSHTGFGHLSDSGASTVLQLDGDSLARPLEQLIGGRRTMVKIDVEGAEALVIPALHNVLASDLTKSVIVEIDDAQLARFGHNSSDVYGLMEKMGYYPEIGAGHRPHFNEVFRRPGMVGE
jgi:FkbM family methyltransferase